MAKLFNANVDIAGTLDVGGSAQFDGSVRVDGSFQAKNFSFQEDVLDQLAAAPVGPTAGDRYIATAAVAWGTVTPAVGDIVERGASDWEIHFDGAAYGEGAKVWDRAANKWYSFDGSSWIADDSILDLTNESVFELGDVTQDSVTDGSMLLWDATGSAFVSKALAGDVTVDETGASSIGADKVTDAMLNDDVATGLAGAGLVDTAGVIDLNTGDGLEILADKLELDLKANAGLKIDAGELAVEPAHFAGAGLIDSGDTLQVNTDNVTLEVNVDTVRIKALGVDTAQLADSSVNSAKIADDSIVDADINSAAAIAESKLVLTFSTSSLDSRITGNDGDITDIRSALGIADGVAVIDSPFSKTDVEAILGQGVVLADRYTGDADIVESLNQIDTDLDVLEAASHDAVTVTDSAEIDFTLTDQNVTASIVAGSIDETKLDVSTNASLDLADGSIQSDGSVAFSGPQSLGGNKLTSGAAGTAATDFVIKSQLDNAVEALSPKESVRTASTADIDLTVAADPSPVDGVTLANNDRILLKDQTASSENGIYLAVDATDPTTWTRTTDMDSGSAPDEISRAYVPVREGTANEGVLFVQQEFSSGDTLDTDPVTFVYFNSATSAVAGQGIDSTELAGNKIQVDPGQGLEFDGGTDAAKLRAKLLADHLSFSGSDEIQIEHLVIDGSGMSFGDGATATTISSTSFGKSASALNGAVALGTSSNALSNAVAVGRSAVARNNSVAIGRDSEARVSGVSIGYRAGQLSTGSDNVLMGFEAGGSITTGSSNIVIGAGADTSAPAAGGEIQLGTGTQTKLFSLAATTTGAGTAMVIDGSGQIMQSTNGNVVFVETFAWVGGTVKNIDYADITSKAQVTIYDDATGEEVVVDSVDHVDGTYDLVLTAITAPTAYTVVVTGK